MKKEHIKSLELLNEYFKNTPKEIVEKEINLINDLEIQGLALNMRKVGVMLPTSTQISLMANKIVNSINNALPTEQKLELTDFYDLEEDWFDWLNDEINGN